MILRIIKIANIVTFVSFILLLYSLLEMLQIQISLKRKLVFSWLTATTNNENIAEEKDVSNC